MMFIEKIRKLVVKSSCGHLQYSNDESYQQVQRISEEKYATNNDFHKKVNLYSQEMYATDTDPHLWNEHIAENWAYGRFHANLGIYQSGRERKL